MRRPTPLPAQDPPPQTTSAGSVTPTSTEPGADDEMMGAPDTSADETQEHVAEAELVDAVSDSVDVRQERIRTRDVWLAARARRQALRAEVRRFTGRRRRRRMLWLSAAGALLLLVVGTIGAAYSPLFAVERIIVVGTDTLDPAELEQALAAQRGVPLPLVDGSKVKAVLVSYPLVESYALEARPPHELVVRIIERTPVGVVQSAAGFSVVDAAGVVLSTETERPEGQPLISVTGGIASGAFLAAGRVIRELPVDMRQRLTAVSATSPNDVTLTLQGATVVWGGADKSALKAVVLQAAMDAGELEGASWFDLSVPDAVIVR